MSETDQLPITDPDSTSQGSLSAESRHHDLLADMAGTPVRSFEELLSASEGTGGGEEDPAKLPGEKSLLDKAQRDDIKENKDDVDKGSRDGTGKEATDKEHDTGKEATDKEPDTGKEATDKEGDTGKEATDKEGDKAEAEKEPDKGDDGNGDLLRKDGDEGGATGSSEDDPDAQVL